jgi:excisionase family DNA binding protein
MPPDQRYFSLEETARYLGLSVKTLYKWAENGQMPCYKLGRLWRFDKTELDRFVRGEQRESFL